MFHFFIFSVPALKVLMRIDGRGWCAMQERDASTIMGLKLKSLIRSHPGRVIAVVAAIMLIVGAALAGIVGANLRYGDVVVMTAGSSHVDEDDAEDREGSGDSSAPVDEKDADAAHALLTVDVDGAVAAPNVIELPAGSRVQDAIEACGGLGADADVSGINRAALLQDGQKVFVPRIGEQAPVDGSSGEAGEPVATGGTLININSATVHELDGLPGVGEATAQAIVDDRDANGAFATVEDLMRVSGIGEKKFEKLRDLICV